MIDFLLTAFVWTLVIYTLIFIVRSIFAYATDRPQPKSTLLNTLANIFIIFFIANLFKRN